MLKDGRVRKNVVKLSLDDHEYDLFIKKTKKTKLTNQAFLYKMVFENYIAVIDFKEIAALRNEINKIGVNVNQIARKVNETETIKSNELDLIKESIKDINKKMDKLVMEILKE